MSEDRVRPGEGRIADIQPNYRAKPASLAANSCRDDLSSTEHPPIRPPHQDAAPAFHSLRLNEAIEFPMLKMLALRLHAMRRLLTTSTCSRGRQIRSTLKDLLSVEKPDVCIVSD